MYGLDSDGANDGSIASELSADQVKTIHETVVAHEACIDIIFDIQSHPEKSLSREELIQLNKFRDEEEVDEGIALLCEQDILEGVESRSIIYYRLTDIGGEYLSRATSPFTHQTLFSVRMAFEEAKSKLSDELKQMLESPRPSSTDERF